MGMKSAAGGEIVQVQGGHIVRSTGRKDRHSKVYTAKGPRDRRVRLSAHTAIQFYDVQDRLGYDRPSKAVDWLIKKAKTAIDKLAELPPWQPTTNVDEGDAPNEAGTSEMVISAEQNFQLQRQQQHQQIGDNDHNNNNNNSSFISSHQSLDSDSIADTMKSFFPTSSAASTINFQSYPSHDMVSRTNLNNNNPNQDLGLSLHSFQDQALIQQTHQETHHHLFTVPATAGFDSSAYQRMFDENRGGGGGGFVFNNMMSLPHHQHQHQQNSFASQRGTLQSSSFAPASSSSIRSWSDEIQMASQRTTPHSSIFGSRFANEAMPVFCIPTRIHDDHVSDRPSSTSSPSSTHH